MRSRSPTQSGIGHWRQDSGAPGIDGGKEPIRPRLLGVSVAPLQGLGWMSTVPSGCLGEQFCVQAHLGLLRSALLWRSGPDPAGGPRGACDGQQLTWALDSDLS